MTDRPLKFRQLVIADLRAKAEVIHGSTSTTELIRTLLSDGASAVILFRLSNELWRLRLAPLAIVVAKLNKWFNSIVIGQGCDIGPGFVVQHPSGVVINGKAVIGSRCVLQSGVVIGAINRRSPAVGDRVEIGSGAKIIGDVTVGNDVLIGANAVVVDDLESGTTAVGIPARAIRHRSG